MTTKFREQNGLKISEGLMRTKPPHQTMWVVLESVVEVLKGLDTWQQMIAGICLSALLALSIRFIIWTPAKMFVKKTDVEWDDELMMLITPVLNYAVFLTGVYFSIVWSMDENSIIATTFATLAVLVIMLLTGRFLSKSVSAFLPATLGSIDERTELEISGATGVIISFFKVIIWGSAILLILAHLNVDITAALASLTIFSLVIGMAVQDSASNFLISVQLMVDKPYEVGDKIQVDTIIGTVAEIGFLSTKIRTFAETLVIVPNRTIANTIVTNYAKGGPDNSPRRVNLKLDITVDYSENPSHVKSVLREILDENEHILSEPAPVILFTHMLDSALSFRINSWVEDYADEWIARDQILSQILKRFDEEEISIPYPHMQIKYDQEEAAEGREATAKKRRVAKARVDEKARAAQSEVERAECRERIEAINLELENDEIEDELKVELNVELVQLEKRLDLSNND